MAELYSVGVNRISYRAGRFATGKTVTAYMWTPSLVKSNLLTFTEVGEGLYYMDYNFATEGTYLGKFFENGEPSTNGVFRVKRLATPTDIKDFSVTRILTAPRNLELIAKSVSNYYRGQVGTLVVMSTYAGAPTDVNMFATVYYPNDTTWMDEVEMTPLGETGLYTKSFLIPEDAPEGVYKVRYKAVKSIAEQQLSDTFTELDGLASNWEVDAGSWEIRSYIYKQLSIADGFYFYSKWKDPLSLEWSNYSIEADVRIDTAYQTLLGVQARYQSTVTRYSLYLDYSNKKLVLCRGTTELASIPNLTFVVGTWYKLKLEMIGARLRVYLDNVFRVERYDETIKTGRPALYAYSRPCSFDNILITIPAQEYVEYEVSDFMVGVSPAQELSVQTVIDRIGIPTSPSIADDLDVIDERTSKLPDDVASISDLEAKHGSGRWDAGEHIEL